MGKRVAIRFLGAAGTVTGSKFLVEAGGKRLLVDCGMFQGIKKLRLMNWDPPPVAPDSVDHVVLTHAHIDHTGYLPRFVRDGYRKHVLATSATCDLLHVLLPDAAHLQEEHARYANRKGFSRHKPALPLFDQADVDRVLDQLDPVPYLQKLELSDTFRIEFRRAGHILGSAHLVLEVEAGGERPIRIVFSGDLGRYDGPILRDPAEFPGGADFLVVESTYGNRSHESFDTGKDELRRVVNASVERGGVLLVPAFAVGRTQSVLYLLRELEDEKAIPRLPVYVDSPMAVKASEFYSRHPEEYDAETIRLEKHRAQPLLPDRTQFCATSRQSKRLNSIGRDAIIISASGMLAGGRILHHAALRLPKPATTLLFTGYQALGTRGRRILDGERTIKIHGQHVPIRAHIEQIHGFSAHGDADEILRWVKTMESAPQRTFVVHGEPEGSAALAHRLRDEAGHTTHIPELGEEVVLQEG